MKSALRDLRTAFLAFQRKEYSRTAAQGICVGLVSTVLFIEIPFCPYIIALLFGLGLGGFALSHPRAALACCVFLSVPSMAYHDTGVWIIYLGLCFLIIGVIRRHWFLGMLTLASIEIWLASVTLNLPALMLLSAIPIIYVGIMLSPSLGATAGAISAVFATFFVLVMTVWIPGLLQSSPIPIEDFGPYDLAQVFSEVEPERALAFATEYLNIFALRISVWVEVALFGVAGYLAGEATNWWRDPRITSKVYPTMLAALSSLFLFLVGATVIAELGPYVLPSISIGDEPHLAVILVALCLFGGLISGVVVLEKNLARVRSIVSAIELRRDQLISRISEAKGKALSVSGYEEEIGRINSGLDNIQRLCNAWKFDESTKWAYALRIEAETLTKGLDDHIGRFDSCMETLESVKAKVLNIRRTILKVEVEYPDIDVSSHKDELEIFSQKIQGIESKISGSEVNLAWFESEVSSLNTRCDRILHQLEDSILVMHGWPIWKSRIQMLLDGEGRAVVEDLYEVPRERREYALSRYYRAVDERVRAHLMFWGDEILLRTTRHLDRTRTEFDKDVIERKEKIQKFEKEHGIEIRPAGSFEALIRKLGLTR